MSDILSLESVSVKYKDILALKDISLSVPSNTFVSVVGPNGAGKSTLLSLLMGLIKPSSGKISVLGHGPGQCPPTRIGYMPQAKTFDRTFPAQAIELVVSGIIRNWPARISKEMKSKAIWLLARAGAEHLAHRQLSELSGGELQRIYLVRAIASEPELLLLDEPVTGIDMRGEIDMHNILKDYRHRSNSVIIMITHDWEAAYHHSDKVLLLNRSMQCYNTPEIAFREENLRQTFEHVGHDHRMIFGVRHHD